MGRIYSNQWDDAVTVEDEYIQEVKKIKGFKKYFDVTRDQYENVIVSIKDSYSDFWGITLNLEDVRDSGCELLVKWNSVFSKPNSNKSVTKFCNDAVEISRVFDEVYKLSKTYSKEINEIRGF